ncbi:MAG: enoyl-CoA hydratase/isomerase family protein [Thermomicrobiales bacterium]|nr:enoyl-CoA hydratase/isomerase family protein [Thermomicrobiales bacterium]
MRADIFATLRSTAPREGKVAIDVARDGYVATVTIDRPEALNAFDAPHLEALLALLRTLRDDRSVRCAIVTGAGDRAFSAGADIKRMATFGPREGRAFAALGHAVTKAIETLPQPVIAAVNGYAFGGGCELALACDIRICSENAAFAQPEVTLGIPPGWGGTQRMPRVVGPGIAAEIIFTGRRVGAAEALRIGLVNAVYPADRLPHEAQALAARIAANSPRAVRAAKAAMSRAFSGEPAAGLNSELDLFGAAFATDDQTIGMEAFIAKQVAEFADE